ncbi:hypothetical protein MSAN_02197300 [Mycena sanguinolenta]|uniref:Uncharacterized protein n=1 Tax=Mycena sanguinolenta TaxID=230812 RepID=A0A8H6XE09_9AGAR|nr:hypothetical protein MSAN_02197300 [Mycena sanguinolenta]
MEECSETTLRAIESVQGNYYQLFKYCTFLNARRKMIHHLLHRNRAEEAIPFAKAMGDEEFLRGDESIPFFHYGEVLVLTRSNDDEAVTMLRLALIGLESGNQTGYSSSMLIKTRTWLARALRNVGLDDEAEILEKWLINWFRKKPCSHARRRVKMPSTPFWSDP